MYTTALRLLILAEIHTTLTYVLPDILDEIKSRMNHKAGFAMQVENNILSDQCP